ncbi:fibronectin type III domain-containing protein [Bacillus thuringiensis]|uniref:fibronectin type III domain-containing protein n=1 Tax=Bacillus thuringiensis TaxID=1428 RepID=UPI00366B4C8F
MRFKKCFVVMSFLLVFMCSFNVYAEEKETNILTKGKGFVIARDIYFKDTLAPKYFDDVIDNNDSTDYYLPSPFYVDLKDNYSISNFRAFIRVNRYNSTTFKMQFYDADRRLIKETKVYPAGSSVSGVSVEYKEEFDVQNVRYLGISGGPALYDLKLFGSKYVPSITNLNSVSGVNDVKFTWSNPKNELYRGVKVFVDNKEIATVSPSDTSYKFLDLESSKEYSFKFVSLYDSNGEILESNTFTRKVSTLVDPKTIPPNPVSFLKADPTDKTVKLKWKKPSDDDLTGFKILKNGKKIAEIGIEEEFTVKDLEPLTEYNFSVVAVDKDKNDSSPVNLSVKTLEEKDDIPPHVPSNVVAKPSNGALIASWDKVPDKDLAGYNVYVDGNKVNSDLVSSTNFTVKKLENKRKYKIQIQAVDRSGNASDLSLAAFGIPDTNTIPIIESTYSLQDVSDGTGVMFSQLWFALAFAVGISLAFYIIYKLKHDVMP